MKIKVLILILPILIFCGCSYYGTYHADYLTCFSVRGTVSDKLTGEPLEKVSLYFIDTGYDSYLSENPYPIKIGESESFGRINLKFCYRWGYEGGIFCKKDPDMSFDIMLSVRFYKDRYFHFKETDLDLTDETVQVVLNHIYLEPETNYDK